MTKALTSLVFLCLCIITHAQEKPKALNEMKLNLNDDGSHYVKATFLNQVWLRYNESNPGTYVLGEPASETFDIGLRRTRLQLYGQITDRVFFYTQFGQNNFNYLSQTSGNRKIQAFFHDAIGEYRITKGSEKLIIGGGLTITNGLSRFSQPSVGTIMTMDVPVFAQATVDQTDEFSRKLSLYARGQLGKLDYRVVLSDPFPITTNGQTPPPLSSDATFSQQGHTKQYQGLFIYNLFDKEPHTTPYMTGTYLGKKKILNLEAGFITQSKATWTRELASPDTTYHNLNLWSAALFYDAPVNSEKGTALSAYAGYFHLDYGPGYLRYNGIMNPASSVSGPYPAGSQGNAFPMFGTGDVFYTQIGYLMKKDLLGEGNGALMPYASLMSAKYERLDKQMNVVAAGVNWLINEHANKISLDVQNRPFYEQQGANLIRSGRKNQVVLQYQIYF
ncbi:MAG: hypothetical protein JNL53_13620 [Cyclobacteriaceae bacterium]|nr:hypothetical protein [Cyclobacteriaceae bacterium]